VSAFPRIVTAGDSALIVEFEERIDTAVNARAIALAGAIAARHLDGVRDVVPTYRTVAIYFDPLRVDYDQLLALASPAADPAERADAEAVAPSPTTVRIPVCYGGDLGPDLPEVASFAGATEDEVVQLHWSMTYRVFMVGFVAGFAYLGTVNPRIAMPRHSTPRLRVPAGSIGIAGAQTGVYPAETPGGWRLIGQTPLKPFDPQRADPFLMKAGDAVAFYPITRTEYDAWPSS
jgi:inhibitor of KinA